MKSPTNQQLEKTYNNYIKGKFLYRAVSAEYLKDIKKHGLTPEKKPFDYFKKELRQFFNIVYNLDKKGYKIIYAWHHEVPPLSKLLRVLRKDISKKYIDLSPNLKENNYYIKRKGGSLVTTILELSEMIKEKKYPLTPKQKKTFDKVVAWCEKRAGYDMVTLKISRTSKYLEKAHFQNFVEKYWVSPFGSFEHFKKIVAKEGLEKYLLRFRGKQNFYLRITKRIPAKEIMFSYKNI